MVKRGEISRTNYSPKELKYKLFKKKICPLCGSKMKLVKDKEFSGQTHKDINVGGGMSWSLIPYSVYKVTESYRCEKCDSEFSISELAERACGA